MQDLVWSEPEHSILVAKVECVCINRNGELTMMDKFDDHEAFCLSNLSGT